MAERWLSKVNGSGHLHYLTLAGLSFHDISEYWSGLLCEVGCGVLYLYFKLLKKQSLTNISWHDLHFYVIPLKGCSVSYLSFNFACTPWTKLESSSDTLYLMSIQWGSFLTFCRLLFYVLPSNVTDPPNFSDATRSVVSFDAHWAVIQTRIKFAIYIDKPAFTFQTHFQQKCPSLTVIYIRPLLIYFPFGLCLKIAFLQSIC